MDILLHALYLYGLFGHDHLNTLILLWFATFGVVLYLRATIDKPFRFALAMPAIPKHYKAKVMARRLFGYDFSVRISVQRVVI